jgi:aspartate racemase
MSKNKDKTVGIIGGMGPEATIDLMQRIILLTPVLDDIDHIRCIVDNNPKVPSRIRAIIEGDGENPGPCMAGMGKKLETHGADFLVIACNTAHYYYDVVQKAVNIPVINMVDLVSKHVKINFPEQDTIGMLASPAVAMTGLYAKKLNKLGIRDIWPDSDYQDTLFNVIKEVKKGNTSLAVHNDFKEVCKHLSNKGVKTAIIACTELGILNSPSYLNFLDAAQILATEIVQIARSEYKIH